MEGDIDWETFMEENRSKMTKRINPSRLYDWLRTKRVLTQEDQEEVEAVGRTTFSRCGLLLDIVKRKGRPGFDALMEIIQYEYPHLYKHLTGKEPEKPPKWFRESFKKRSHLFELMPQIVNVLNGISNEMCQKKDDLKKLIDDLKVENETLRSRLDSAESLEKEYNALQKKLLKSQAYCIELNKDKEAIQEHCSELVLYRDEALEQVNILEAKVHELELELNNSRGECTLERSKSRKLRTEIENTPSSHELTKITLENEALEAQLRKMKQQMQRSQAAHSREVEILSAMANRRIHVNIVDEESLQTRLLKAQEEKKTVAKEKDELQNSVEELQQQRENLKMQVGQLQERIEKHGERLNVVKEERDKYLKNNEGLNRQVAELTTQRDKLESDRDELWRIQDDLQLEVQHLKNTVDRLNGHAGSNPATPTSSNSNSLEEDYEITDTHRPRTRRVLDGVRDKEKRDGTIFENGYWNNWSYIAPEDK